MKKWLPRQYQFLAIVWCGLACMFLYTSRGDIYIYFFGLFSTGVASIVWTIGSLKVKETSTMTYQITKAAEKAGLKRKEVVFDGKKLGR